MPVADDPEAPPQTPPMIRAIAMPSDANANGDIFGGWLMSNADIAGAILAYRRAKGRVVTVAVDSFVFIKPVYVGDLVSFYTDLRKVGNTSCDVDVTMFAESDWGGEDVRRVATATMTYVHVNEQHRPTPIPPQKD